MPSRTSLLTAAVVILLVAVIALAGHDWTEDSSETGIVSVSPEHSSDGAQRAAAAISSAIGSEAMFQPTARRQVVRRIAHPAVEQKMQAEYARAYDALGPRIGLDKDGRPPSSTTFVARTMPAGTTLQDYSADDAVVRVWANGILDLAGPGPEAAAEEMTQSWFTMTLTLRWHGDRWRLIDSDQTSGPEPDDTDAHHQFGHPPPL
ncbi:hypothetical protein ACFWHG_36555 [Streptomyces microflavus]|uniref:hypothetical protein n=1 Tax=Streptomyces microflavus TaxID=1919 RepID=UPI00365F50AC